MRDRVFGILTVLLLLAFAIDGLSMRTRLPMQGGVRLAVIGDFGIKGHVGQVSALVHSWNPDAILTVGDNLQGSGEIVEYDNFVYPFYGDYIERGLFYPALGNHDWGYPWGRWKAEEIPLLKVLELPGNERYYDVVFGDNLVHVFFVDSDRREPDGRSADSIQGRWLKSRLEASTAVYQLVILHEPPYSSCMWGDQEVLQWPFREWGAEAVFSGHCHNYERVMMDGFPYFINGLGGAPNLTPFETLTEGSTVRFIDDWGAQMIEATSNELTVTFITTGGEVVDRYVISAQ